MTDNFYHNGPDEITEKFYGADAARRHQERFDQGIVDDWIPMKLDIVSDEAGIRGTLILQRVMRMEQ
ncbi:MAG: hypothetical protein ACTHPD_09775 [Rhizomicrobium sp.]